MNFLPLSLTKLKWKCSPLTQDILLHVYNIHISLKSIIAFLCLKKLKIENKVTFFTLYQYDLDQVISEGKYGVFKICNTSRQDGRKYNEVNSDF